MLTSTFIIAISAVLFVYWFRYSCLLLLQQRRPETAPTDPRFDFAGMRSRLGTEIDLAPLHAALSRDYLVLLYIRQHAAGLGLDTLEDRMLVWDYKLMQVWYRATRLLAPAKARHALREMTSVLEVLAGRALQQADAQAGASL